MPQFKRKLWFLDHEDINQSFVPSFSMLVGFLETIIDRTLAEKMIVHQFIVWKKALRNSRRATKRFQI